MAKNTKKIKPLYDYLLIEPLEEETKLPSGIVIPDSAKEKPQRGRVVAAGSGKKDESGKIVPLEVRVGDIVMYKKWGGTEVKIDGKEHLLVKEDDILAIYE
jgi:chaperonin GroES